MPPVAEPTQTRQERESYHEVESKEHDRDNQQAARQPENLVGESRLLPEAFSAGCRQSPALMFRFDPFKIRQPDRGRQGHHMRPIVPEVS